MDSEELKSIRKRLGLTQTELGAKIGVSMRAVQTWETNQRNMSPATEKAIRALLDEKVRTHIVYEPFEHTFLANTNGNEFELLPDGTYSLKVDLIPVRAYARYISEINDGEVLDGYEPAYFRVDKYARGSYKAFEIKGDSMWNEGGYDTPDKATVLARELGRHLWKDGFRSSQYGWIIVTRNNIVFKDIIDQDLNIGTITCHSRNPSPEYADFTLSLDEDVRQIFKVIKRQF